MTDPFLPGVPIIVQIALGLPLGLLIGMVLFNPLNRWF
jgi:hypothetical protein